jgi:hypothetical protein
MIWSKADKTIGTDLSGTKLDRDRRDERDVQGLDRYCDYYVYCRSCTSWMRPVYYFNSHQSTPSVPYFFANPTFLVSLQPCCKRTHSWHCIRRHSHKSTRYRTICRKPRASPKTPYFLSFCPHGSSRLQYSAPVLRPAAPRWHNHGITNNTSTRTWIQRLSPGASSSTNAAVPSAH